MITSLSYTSLDMAKLEKKYKLKGEKKTQHSEFDSTFNTILLTLASLTALIISIILFLLIKKQINLFHG